jgi:hypothetical protein
MSVIAIVWSRGVNSPYSLFSHTNTTGRCSAHAMLAASWKAPMFVDPSPKKATAMLPSSRYLLANPAPTRAALALAVAGRLAHQLGHHLVELPTLGDEVPVAAVRRGDLVVVGERGAHARGDRLLADIEMEEARQLGGLGQLTGRLLEQADADHAAVQVHQDLGREFHGAPVRRVEGQRLRIVTPLIPGAP